MPDQPPIASSLMLDALTEFSRVVDALPAPGRGGAIGRLNPGVTTLLHVTRDTAYVANLASGATIEPWLLEQLAGGAEPPPFEDARDAFQRARVSMTAFLEGARPVDLARVPVTEVRPDLPAHLVGATLEYLIARTAAHIFVHAGEMSALASLVGAPDLGLPGAMAATRGSVSDQ